MKKVSCTQPSWGLSQLLIQRIEWRKQILEMNLSWNECVSFQLFFDEQLTVCHQRDAVRVENDTIVEKYGASQHGIFS